MSANHFPKRTNDDRRKTCETPRTMISAFGKPYARRTTGSGGLRLRLQSALRADGSTTVPNVADNVDGSRAATIASIDTRQGRRSPRAMNAASGGLSGVGLATGIGALGVRLQSALRTLMIASLGSCSCARDAIGSGGLSSWLQSALRATGIGLAIGIVLIVTDEQGWSQIGTKPMEAPCESFSRVLGYHENGYALVDGESRIFTTGYSNRSGALFQEFIVTKGKAEYIGLLQIYPSNELIRFGEHYEQGCVPQARGSSPLRDFKSCRTETAKEIDSLFGSQSERFKPEKVVTRELSTFTAGPGDSSCDAFAVQLRTRLEGSPDSWRVFLRNYRLGRRHSSDRYCDVWDQENQQLLFYEAFVPAVLSIDGKSVVVDEQFPGILRDGKFQHLCELSQAVQSYSINSDALIDAAQKFGNVCSAESGPSLWSCQVSRNILIGNEIVKSMVKPSNLAPPRPLPAPSVWPRATAH